ncbi:hypothetical protein JNUCC0626_50330 (plasmid) [Lentzea sp. JNUCC 0626]|uniref:hypothetical protein n=1 Tax=Lentzea sp. JNUCC 0626 TaxID=3367513 RepID=UPI003748C30F
MNAPSETIARFQRNDVDYELDHLGIAVPEQWGQFAIFTGGEMIAEFRMEFSDAVLVGGDCPTLPDIAVLEKLARHELDVTDGAPDQMTLRTGNRDVLAAWCGGTAPDDLGSDVLYVDRPEGRAVIVLGQTVERTDTGFRILDCTDGAV